MSISHISRRGFLQMAGISVDAAGLVGAGMSSCDMAEPNINFVEETVGDSTMAKKILVAYSSRVGSTSGVAKAIGKTLAKLGMQVDVRLMNDVKDLTQYQAVIAGSAIRDKKWLPEAMMFLNTFKQDLASRPFAAFLVCITLAMPNGSNYLNFVQDFMQPVRAVVKPVFEGYFAGALDYSKVPFIPEGMQLRILSAASKTPPGDYRDWTAIDSWAESLPVRLGL